MKQTAKFQFNPRLDLKLERVVALSREEVWKAWTTPDILKKWFCPVPWKVSEAEIDLRPGGLFRTVMVSPEGEEIPKVGCYLEVIENEKLVWTDALTPGYHPSESSFMTGIINLEDHPGGGTKYTAYALHGTAAHRKQHEEMGFEQGWSKSLDQLVQVMKQIT